MKKNLLELVAMYGAYLQQKGRATADAYLKQENVDPATSALVAAGFSEKGKLVKSDGSAVGMLDLMKFKSLI
jgi:hypothetical protein